MRNFFMALALIIAAGAVFSPRLSSNAGEVGRFQLVQARYTHWAGQAVASENVELWLFDTATGEAKIYVSTSAPGDKNVKYWTPAIVDETKTNSEKPAV